MDIKEGTIYYEYPSGDIAAYEITLVNYKEPYRYSKWLFTQLVDAHPYFSYQAENDEELLILFAKQAIGAISITIQYND